MKLRHLRRSRSALFGFCARLALLAFSLTLCVPSAYAGKWRQNEIKWHKSSVGSPWSATAIYQRDTTYTVVAASILDTTGNFSASDADVWPGQGTATGSPDTTIVGWLVIQSDTSVASSSAVTSITCEIDGRAGGYGVVTDNAQGWQQVDSLVVLVTADAAFGGTISVPVLARNNLFVTTQGAGGAVFNAYYRLTAFEDLRARITATTGVMGAARVWWRYWDED